jgi:hypothetical protein
VRTLALRGGARIPIDPADWSDALFVVTRGRILLERSDGTPGPVLGRDAAFWIRDTGVRALRNPGARAATVRILTRSASDPVDASVRRAHRSPNHGGTR